MNEIIMKDYNTHYNVSIGEQDNTTNYLGKFGLKIKNQKVARDS